jgi:hypothetical protein
VRFLIDPKEAEDQVEDGFLLVPANRDEKLFPALRQVIETQPQYASWISSSLCFYYTDAVRLGKRRIVEKNSRIAQMVGIWSLATAEKETGARRDLVLDMYASRERLRTAAAADLIRLHEVDVGFRPASDTSGTEYSQTIGKTRLIWNGRPAGDTLKVERPITTTWQVPGVRGVTWSAQLSLSPSSGRALVGSLRVAGKGDLAKSLKESPIRFVGPFYRGGAGEVRFTR